MSSNSLFMNSGKKRNTSIIYSVENLPSQVPVSTFSGLSNRGKKNISHGSEGFPPNKRHKGEQAKDAKANEDLFGDNEDFTADDLEELDILASQVIIQETKPGSNAPTTSVTDKNNKDMPVVKDYANAKDASFSTRALNSENIAKGLHENGLIQCKNVDSFGFEVLQEQHSKLREQFNEVQEELQIKKGEIKILRDCLRRVESEHDQQKRLHLLSEQEKSETQNQREKDFSKKVQSLQSELQFKDAEMNELRTKLKSCERTAKSPIMCVAKVSPREHLSGSNASQTGKKYFPDKKSFAAEMSPVHSVLSASTTNQLALDKETRDLKEFHIAKKEMSQKSSCLNSIQGKIFRNRHSEGSAGPHSICTGAGKQAAWSKADLLKASRRCRGRVEGAVLMTMLLSQPVGPQNLGLSHLLHCSSEAFTEMVQHHSFCSSTDSSSTEKSSEERIKEMYSNLHKHQQLALYGINLLILDQELSRKKLDITDISRELRKHNDLPGAIHLLPLIEYYLDIYCQSLQTEKGERSPSRNRNCCSSNSGELTASNVDDCLHNLEDFALTALGVLYHLVSHSQTVGNSLLAHTSSQSTEGGTCSAAQVHNKSTPPVEHGKEEAGSSRLQKDQVKLQESADSEQSPTHLFNKLLQLSDTVTINISHRRESVQDQSLRVLGKVAESASAALLHRFHHLLSSQVLLRCLSPDSSCSIVLLVVQLLANLADHVELASKFCSQSAACLFLNLYTYASSRPDTSAGDGLWLQLEQEIVRFITKFGLSHSGASAVLVESDCLCNTEILKTLIVMLHRQWLTIRLSTQNLSSLGNQAVVQFLRETVLLLHCLSQRDKNFTDHCFVVLHLYDQVMHGIKAIFKNLADLEENEEIALEELCSPEPEAEYRGLETDGP
ncbi:ATR-interacting protein isoform X1 [Leucoraja erinacea]|uniref:ATR-interacting protein isoform X1 n=1 Tax=Leucoraja erinaceus TaxID=7782 RepID=UPI0024543194|nr:ATR-interacting protein isoform X1 [Leucoraja erinacea]